jgi:hypothetical protein
MKPLFCILALCVIALAQHRKLPAVRHSNTEQTVFSAEDESVKNPVPLPAAAEKLILQDPDVQSVLESEAAAADKLPPSWYSASNVHLCTPTAKDLVVVGNPPLSGGNTARFWVLHKMAAGYAVVLDGPTHSLEIKNTRHHGCRDIELISASAVQFSTTTLHFNGNKYGVYHTKTEDIR